MLKRYLLPLVVYVIFTTVVLFLTYRRVRLHMYRSRFRRRFRLFAKNLAWEELVEQRMRGKLPPAPPGGGKPVIFTNLNGGFWPTFELGMGPMLNSSKFTKHLHVYASDDLGFQLCKQKLKPPGSCRRYNTTLAFSLFMTKDYQKHCWLKWHKARELLSQRGGPDEVLFLDADIMVFKGGLLECTRRIAAGYKGFGFDFLYSPEYFKGLNSGILWFRRSPATLHFINRALRHENQSGLDQWHAEQEMNGMPFLKSKMLPFNSFANRCMANKVTWDFRTWHPNCATGEWKNTFMREIRKSFSAAALATKGANWRALATDDPGICSA